MTAAGRPDGVTAIIVNYNAGPHLRACLDALVSQAQHIVVVDNLSTDDSLSRIEDLVHTGRVTLVRNSANLGFAAACNIGLDRAGGGDALFLNPDCVLERGALALLAAALVADPKVGMAGGHLLNPDGSEQRGGRRDLPTPRSAFVRAFALNRLWPSRFRGFDRHETALPQGPVEVEAISGACMLVRGSAIAEVGHWDEGYFLHCEDLDWCMRFHRAGWKVVFVPVAKVRHVKGASSGSRPVFVEWHKHRGMLRYYRKFYGESYGPLAMLTIGAGVWLRFAAIAGIRTAQRLATAGRRPSH